MARNSGSADARRARVDGVPIVGTTERFPVKEGNRSLMESTTMCTAECPNALVEAVELPDKRCYLA